MTTAFDDLTAETFDLAVSSSEELLVVDFWAEWCSPCKAYEPIIAEVAAERADSVVVGRVDIMKYPELAEQAGVKTVPALVFFRDGEIVKRMFGVRGKRQLGEEMDRLSAWPGS